jgi:hypothetical protein
VDTQEAFKDVACRYNFKINIFFEIFLVEMLYPRAFRLLLGALFS